MRSVYIETSVWAMTGTDQPEILRGLSLEFLKLCENHFYSAHISDIVGNELKRASPEARQIVLGHLNRVNPSTLLANENVEQLAQQFISHGILSERRMEDALHVACAIVHELDILVNWNYRHIANIRKAEAFNAIAVLAGLNGNLEIHTPMELVA